MDIRDILESQGYPVIDGGTYISTKALFRGGDNPTAICIYPQNNLVIDFPNKERYDIKTLIGLILGIKDQEKIDEYIHNNSINVVCTNNKIEEKLIETPKKLQKKLLDGLEKNHHYWTKRGINPKILQQLGGGIKNGRYYFPIWNGTSLVGITARDITGKSKAKWLHKGKKTEWIWPSIEHVKKTKEVFLVESPGDALSLMTCGINNVLCVFGSDCSWVIINALLRIQGIKINIAFNSDEAGDLGAIKTYKKFKKYFDTKNIKICFPLYANDWNDLLLKMDGEQKILFQLGKNSKQHESK